MCDKLGGPNDRSKGQHLPQEPRQDRRMSASPNPRLAIGTSDFAKLREAGALYVDKTDLIRRVSPGIAGDCRRSPAIHGDPQRSRDTS